MQKLGILLFLFVALGFIACGEKQEETEDSPNGYTTNICVECDMTASTDYIIVHRAYLRKIFDYYILSITDTGDGVDLIGDYIVCNQTDPAWRNKLNILYAWQPLDKAIIGSASISKVHFIGRKGIVHNLSGGDTIDETNSYFHLPDQAFDLLAIELVGRYEF